MNGTTNPAALPAGHRPDAGAAEIWVLHADPAQVAAAEKGYRLLDPVERKRAEDLVKPTDRATYVVAHVGLRVLLGGYLGLAPEEVAVERDACPVCGAAHGRPLVEAEPPLHFSLSHARSVAVCAFASSPVGVDVERGSAEAAEELTALLHPAERAAVEALPEELRGNAFLHCWVRKEAYLKGIGVGLAAPLDSVDVGLGPVYGAPGPAPGELNGWALAQFPAPGDHAAAVALLLPPQAAAVRTSVRVLDLAAAAW